VRHIPGQLEQGGQFSHVFRRAGTFAYHCSIHPTMRGTVKVTG
jgi:plastocyanin